MRSKAMQKIYQEHKQQLYTYALSIVKHPDVAEDAIHETIMKILKTNKQPENLKRYLFRSLRNTCIDQLRSKPIACGDLDACIFDASPSPNEAAAKQQDEKFISNALFQLCEDERETIIQHLYANLTFREISEIRDIPLGTVTSWYRRGIEKLRSSIGERT